MEEVLNKEDANYVVIFSEAYGLKRVIEKVYFHLDEEKDMQEMMHYIADNYSWLISTGMRIDMGKVINGATVGGRR